MTPALLEPSSVDIVVARVVRTLVEEQLEARLSSDRDNDRRNGSIRSRRPRNRVYELFARAIDRVPITRIIDEIAESFCSMPSTTDLRRVFYRFYVDNANGSQVNSGSNSNRAEDGDLAGSIESELLPPVWLDYLSRCIDGATTAGRQDFFKMLTHRVYQILWSVDDDATATRSIVNESQQTSSLIIDLKSMHLDAFCEKNDTILRQAFLTGFRVGFNRDERTASAVSDKDDDSSVDSRYPPTTTTATIPLHPTTGSQFFIMHHSPNAHPKVFLDVDALSNLHESDPDLLHSTKCPKWWKIDMPRFLGSDPVISTLGPRFKRICQYVYKSAYALVWTCNVKLKDVAERALAVAPINVLRFANSLARSCAIDDQVNQVFVQTTVALVYELIYKAAIDSSCEYYRINNREFVRSLDYERSPFKNGEPRWLRMGRSIDSMNCTSWNSTLVKMRRGMANGVLVVCNNEKTLAEKCISDTDAASFLLPPPPQPHPSPSQVSRSPSLAFFHEHRDTTFQLLLESIRESFCDIYEIPIVNLSKDDSKILDTIKGVMRHADALKLSGIEILAKPPTKCRLPRRV